MPYVRTIPYAEAEGQLKDAYDEILERRGRISNVSAVNSLRPEVMRTLARHNQSILDDPTSGLTEAEKQMVATLVSALNKCQY